MSILNWLRRNLLYVRDEDYFPDCQLFLDDRHALLAQLIGVIGRRRAEVVLSIAEEENAEQWLLARGGDVCERLIQIGGEDIGARLVAR